MGIHFMLCILSYLLLVAIPAGCLVGFAVSYEIYGPSEVRRRVICGAIVGVAAAALVAAIITCGTAIVRAPSGLPKIHYSWEWPQQQPAATPAEAH